MSGRTFILIAALDIHAHPFPGTSPGLPCTSPEAQGNQRSVTRSVVAGSRLAACRVQRRMHTRSTIQPSPYRAIRPPCRGRNLQSFCVRTRVSSLSLLVRAYRKVCGLLGKSSYRQPLSPIPYDGPRTHLSMRQTRTETQAMIVEAGSASRSHVATLAIVSSRHLPPSASIRAI